MKFEAWKMIWKKWARKLRGLKKDGQRLDAESAGQILENVFEFCRMEPCKVPLEVLESYSNYRTERFYLQRVAIVVMMVLFCLLPFLFVMPTFSLDGGEPNGLGQPTYRVEVDTFLPISRVTAQISFRVSFSIFGVFNV